MKFIIENRPKITLETLSLLKIGWNKNIFQNLFKVLLLLLGIALEIIVIIIYWLTFPFAILNSLCWKWRF